MTRKKKFFTVMEHSTGVGANIANLFKGQLIGDGYPYLYCSLSFLKKTSALFLNFKKDRERKIFTHLEFTNLS